MYIDITTEEERLAMYKKQGEDIRKNAIYAIVQDFIDKQDITCIETIYQTDRVIENAYEFIERLCNVVGYKEFEDDEDD